MTSTPHVEARPVNWPKMRPRFTVTAACPPEAVIASLRRHTDSSEEAIRVKVSERHGLLTMPESERQFWSTQLGLTVEAMPPGEDGVVRGARVLGVFSPHPEIWTAFVFAIGTLAVIGVFGLMYAIVQLSMGQAPWALLASLVAALVAGLVYTSTLVGQGLAASEMYTLRSFFDDRLAEAEKDARREPRTARASAQL